MPDGTTGEPFPGTREAAAVGARRAIARQIELPVPVAVWVLLAHALTLFAPLLVTWVLRRHAEALATSLDVPFLLDIGVALFFAGSAFEIAQNTTDRWYYEGPYPAFADLLFNWAITLGLGAFAVAAVSHPLVVTAAVLAGIAFPLLYLRDVTPYPAMGVAGVLAVGALYAALGDPVILLLLVFSTGLNLYFLEAIVRTHAQPIHGAIALSNGLGMAVVALALAPGIGLGRAVSVALAAVIAVLAALAWPWLSRRPATRRPSD